MSKARNTKQRQLILETLQKTDTHPTADWIYQKVRDKMPNVSLGTVYRNLGVLKEQQIIQELHHAGSQSRYDGNPHPHYHFFCLGCGRVDDVPGLYSEEVDCKFTCNMPDYAVLGHNVEFYGLCPECNKSTHERGVTGVAEFVCKECGAEKEGRCKPRKCPQCGAENSFAKKE